MPNLPAELAFIIATFRPLFSQRVWRCAHVLLIGAILAPGKRTVASALRVMGIWADGAYAGSGLQHWVRCLPPWGNVRLEIVRKPRDSAASRFCLVLDRRANLRVARPMATAQGRLRVLTGNDRSPHSYCDDPAHAAETRPTVTLFKRALTEALF